MRATLPAFLSLTCLLLTSGLDAQDAPAPDEPTLKLGAPGVEDDGAEKIKLGGGEEGETPVPAGGSDGETDSADEKLEVGGAGEATRTGIPASIKKMSDEEKRKLASLLQDASSYLGGVRVQEAFEKLVEAESMAPDYAAVHNLIGAAHTKVRNFDKAAAAFEKSVELDPQAFMSRFNLTEIHFVQHKWEQAEKEFAQLIEINKAMPESTKSLIEFKILICMLKQGNEDGAQAILKKFDFLDDHPAFFFCNAAIHFSKSEDDEARGWMASAERVFPAGQNSIYADSFIEVGWIENLQ